MDYAIAGTNPEQRGGGVKGHRNSCTVVQGRALGSSRKFDACRGLFVRGEISDRLFVYDVNELSGAIVARYRDGGAVTRKCDVANALSWVGAFWRVKLPVRR